MRRLQLDGGGRAPPPPDRSSARLTLLPAVRTAPGCAAHKLAGSRGTPLRPAASSPRGGSVMKTEERNRTRQRHTWWGPLARGKARSGPRHAWRPALLSHKLSLLRGALVESLTAPLRAVRADHVLPISSLWLHLAFAASASTRDVTDHQRKFTNHHHPSEKTEARPASGAQLLVRYVAWLWLLVPPLVAVSLVEPATALAGRKRPNAMPRHLPQQPRAPVRFFFR
jgi:hypothetical protein